MSGPVARFVLKAIAWLPLAFAVWYFANRVRLSSGGGDPVATLWEIWYNVRWSLAGMAIFAVDWIWALLTSLGVLGQAKRAEAATRAASPPGLA